MVPTARPHRLELLESPDYRHSCLETLRALICLNPRASWASEPEKFLLEKPYLDSEGEEAHAQTKKFKSTHRLSQLRRLMALNNITTYIVPSEDQHQSEYTAVQDQRREYISGFTGSAGVAIVTQTAAALFTDSRYFIQASIQLDDNWTLLKQGQDNWIEWLINQTSYEKTELDSWGTVAVDPKLISTSLGKSLNHKIHFSNLKFLTDLDGNLVDLIKKKNGDVVHPKVTQLEIYDMQYAGQSVQSKLNDIRKAMKDLNASTYIVSMLDSIAWVLNLRGDDVAFTPIFFSYLIITHDMVSIYIDKSKLNDKLYRYLKQEISHHRLEILPYNQIWDDLPALCNQTVDDKIVLDLNANYSIFHNIPQGSFEIVFKSIVQELKGLKNQTEIENNVIAQLNDSIAIIRTFAWIKALTHHNKAGNLTEWDICEKSLNYRSQMPNFKGLSFSTIAGSGANSAIVHYEPTEQDNSQLDLENGILLLDSGGQYLNGTTDITRTIYLGKTPASPKQIKAYTLVLKGHLNVAMLSFSKGTSSYWIDSLAREPLRKQGWDYGHGTGHGIDNYIGVHSGPCGLSPSETGYNYKPLEVGNFLSDEPGVYFDEEFGIRIESDIAVIQNPEKDSLLKFDYLTMVPFERELIDASLLDPEQIQWINDYHKLVVVKTSPILEKMGDQDTLNWLRMATQEI